MSIMTVRELNANVSRAIAMAEAGEAIDITRNGRVVAELRPKRPQRRDDPEWQAAYASLMEAMTEGLPLGGPFSYDERTGR